MKTFPTMQLHHKQEAWENNVNMFGYWMANSLHKIANSHLSWLPMWHGMHILNYWVSSCQVLLKHQFVFIPLLPLILTTCQKKFYKVGILMCPQHVHQWCSILAFLCSKQKYLGNVLKGPTILAFLHHPS
jgi:hypothetical protein